MTTRRKFLTSVSGAAAVAALPLGALAGEIASPEWNRSKYVIPPFLGIDDPDIGVKWIPKPITAAALWGRGCLPGTATESEVYYDEETDTVEATRYTIIYIPKRKTEWLFRQQVTYKNGSLASSEMRLVYRYDYTTPALLCLPMDVESGAVQFGYVGGHTPTRPDSEARLGWEIYGYCMLMGRWATHPVRYNITQRRPAADLLIDSYKAGHHV